MSMRGLRAELSQGALAELIRALEGAQSEMQAAVAAEREACAMIAAEFDDFEYVSQRECRCEIARERDSMKKLATAIRARK